MEEDLTARYVEFSITFRRSNGDPVVIDNRGNEIDPVNLSIEDARAMGTPIRTDHIEALSRSGSHFYVLIIGTSVWHIPLPH